MPQFTRVVDDKFIKSGAKVTMPYNIEDVMNRIKEKLTDAHNEMFSKTCFGPFLNFTKFTPSPQILHNLLCKIANVLGGMEEEMYFEICGKLLSYSLYHFAMITRLKCEGNANYRYAVTTERSEFAKAYFKQPAKFKRKTLESWFPEARMNYNEDAMKLTLMYLVASFILNNNSTVSLPEFFVNLVDNLENFNNFSWGKVV